MSAIVPVSSFKTIRQNDLKNILVKFDNINIQEIESIDHIDTAAIFLWGKLKCSAVFYKREIGNLANCYNLTTAWLISNWKDSR